MSAPNVRFVEHVAYYPFRVTFRLSDGRRLRRVRWSPGFPWVIDEVLRELVDNYGVDGIKPGTVKIAAQ